MYIIYQLTNQQLYLPELWLELQTIIFPRALLVRQTYSHTSGHVSIMWLWLHCVFHRVVSCSVVCYLLFKVPCERRKGRTILLPRWKANQRNGTERCRMFKRQFNKRDNNFKCTRRKESELKNLLHLNARAAFLSIVVGGRNRVVDFT